jgi:protein associated with RNAse G/E
VAHYWKYGESCVLRGIVNDQVWLAQSVIVVKDEPDETILLLIPGAQCAYPEGYWRWKTNNDFSQGNRWQEAKKEKIALRIFTWTNYRILMFLQPGKFYSCNIFWDPASDIFAFYYINYQLPFQRSHCGFDTLDLDLDLVIDSDFQWHWKDETDYQEGIREGGIRGERVEAIEQSHAEVFKMIESRNYPLDGSWEDWKPELRWKAPVLLYGWSIVRKKIDIL